MEDDPLIGQCRARVGQLISGKWRLDALIGVGGMAAVYMATHRNGAVGAVKILHDEVALNEEVRERFLREAYIANKVGHPGTVKVQDDDVDEKGTPFLVMELPPANRSSDAPKKPRPALRSKRRSTSSTRRSRCSSRRKQAIVHTRPQAGELFLTADRQHGQGARLRYRAVARRTPARPDRHGHGTPSFMAPEQDMGRWNDVDARTDIYAVGATAFTLLTGLPVHEARPGEMLWPLRQGRLARSLAS